ncbi:MAG: OmpH family outer membrane protein [Thermodesulfovibrionales bacterium]
MKKLLVLLAAVFIMLPWSAFAAQPAEQQLKIGVVDIQKVLAESKTVQGYRDKLGKDIESRQKTFADKQKAAAQIEERLSKGRSTMSEKDQRALQDSLSDARKELQRLKEDLELEVKKLDRDLTQKMMKEVSDIITQIFDKEGYTIILEKNAAGVLKERSSIDITDKVMKIYDKK